MWKKLKRSERLLSFFRLLKCWTVAIGELSSASVVACNKRYICTFYDFFVSYVARTIFSFSAVVVFFAGQFEKRSKRKKLQSAPNLNLAPATMNAFIRSITHNYRFSSRFCSQKYGMRVYFNKVIIYTSIAFILQLIIWSKQTKNCKKLKWWNVDGSLVWINVIILAKSSN